MLCREGLDQCVSEQVAKGPTSNLRVRRLAEREHLLLGESGPWLLSSLGGDFRVCKDLYFGGRYGFLRCRVLEGCSVYGVKCRS